MAHEGGWCIRGLAVMKWIAIVSFLLFMASGKRVRFKKF